MSRTFMRFPEGKAKALTFSYDDGVTQDIRLIGIFRKYGLKGTFNLNSANFGVRYNQFQELVKAEEVASVYEGQEVAVHGWDHDFPDKLPTDRVLYEIFMDRCRIEEVSGKIVRGMAYPWGRYDERTIEAAKTAGIVYSRTTNSTEGFGITADWMRLPATCHHNNENLFKIAERFTEGSPEKEPYDRDPWLFYVWGHAYEFDINNNWDRIEKFAETVGGRDDVWYATNIEIRDYVEAYRNLNFSADGEIVRNPFASDVWLERNRHVFKIPAGETGRSKINLEISGRAKKQAPSIQYDIINLHKKTRKEDETCAKYYTSNSCKNGRENFGINKQRRD